MQLQWSTKAGAQGVLPWVDRSSPSAVDSRQPGISVQGEVTIEECRFLRLAASTFVAPLPTSLRMNPQSSRTESLPTAPAQDNRWQAGTPLSRYNPSIITPETGGLFLLEAISGGSMDKAAALLRNPPIKADTRLVTVTVTNRGDRSVPCSLAFTISPQGVWHETILTDVPARAQRRLTVDLRSSLFRTEATRWQPSSPLPTINGVNGLLVVVYNRTQEAKVHLDAVTFTGP